MSQAFRTKLVLMALARYDFGDHVTDAAAFIRRCQTVPELSAAGPFQLAGVKERLVKRLAELVAERQTCTGPTG